jgi:hypothetical protein
VRGAGFTLACPGTTAVAEELARQELWAQRVGNAGATLPEERWRPGLHGQGFRINLDQLPFLVFPFISYLNYYFHAGAICLLYSSQRLAGFGIGDFVHAVA